MQRWHSSGQEPGCHSIWGCAKKLVAFHRGAPKKWSAVRPPAGRRAAGRPSVPDRAPESPWGRRGLPRGSEHQLCTNTGQPSDPSSDYMLRAALEGTHFFLGENRHAPKIDLLFGFIVTRQTAMPIQIGPRFCARGLWSIRKVTLPLSKLIAMRHHR